MSRGAQPKPYRIASAIPGRIRVQLGRLRDQEMLLERCRRRLCEIAAVQETRAAADAGSLIVRFDRAAIPVAELLEAIEPIVQDELAEWQRTAIRPARNGRGRGRNAGNGTASPAAIGRDTLTAVGSRARALAERIPGQTEILHAMNLVNDRPAGFKPLLISTIAVVLAALDGVPLAITATVLALAAIPIAKRAAKGLGDRQLTVDQLDLVNIALVAIGGQVFAAGIIAWLVSLGEAVRGKAVGYSRESIGRLLPAGHEAISPEVRAAIERLYRAELSNSRFQDEAVRCGNATAYPLFALAVLMYALTRDPGVIVSILKPRTDYTSGLRLGIPVPVLNALIISRQRGPLITSAAALEKLTLLDAILVTPGAERGHGRALARLERGLARRGVRLLPIDVPTGSNGGDALDALQRRGAKVGILGTARELAAERRGDVRILLDERSDLAMESVDVFLMEGGLDGLTGALDSAWECARICQQNTGLYGAAAATNLTMGLLRWAPPPLSSIVNAVTTSAVAGNSLRPLLAEPRRRNVRRLPEVVPTGGGGE